MMNCFEENNPLPVFLSAGAQELLSYSQYQEEQQPHQQLYSDAALPAARPHSPYLSDQDSLKKTRKPRGRRVATTETIDSAILTSGKKLFICNEQDCGKVFKRAEHLSRHHRMHSGERPYPCTECERAFSRSDNLAAHISRAHKHAQKPINIAQPNPYHPMSAFECMYENRPESSLSMMNYPSLTPPPSRPMSAMSTGSSYPGLSFSPAHPDTPSLPSDYAGIRENSNMCSPFQGASFTAASDSNDANHSHLSYEYPMIYAPAPRPIDLGTGHDEEYFHATNRWML